MSYVADVGGTLSAYMNTDAQHAALEDQGECENMPGKTKNIDTAQPRLPSGLRRRP